MTPSFPTSKAEWRAWGKARREELARSALSARLVAQLEAWPGYQRAQHVLTYLAFGSELDLAALDARGKILYATRSHGGRSSGEHGGERRLSIHFLDVGLERHPLGFLQPADGPEVAPARIDLALVPGLLFDPSGARLGYGLGFYDRLLPQLRANAPRVGVTCESLIVPSLLTSAHDVPMTHLLTESGVRAAR